MALRLSLIERRKSTYLVEGGDSLMQKSFTALAMLSTSLPLSPHSLVKL